MANFANSKGGKRGGKKQTLVAAGSLPVLTDHNEPRCKVCQSPYRREIDMCLATGWSQRSVIDHFNALLAEDERYGPDYFSPNNMSTHKNRHMTVRDIAVRKIMESRAKALGVDVENVEGMILTHEATLETIVQAGLEQLRNGLTSSEPKDVLAAIQMLKQIEADFTASAVDELTNQFKAFADAVEEIVTPEQGKEIFQRTQELLAQREIKLMRPQLQAPQKKADVVEVEAIEVEEE